MRILLIHPEDNPEKGPWATLAWDRVVDLGLGGVSSYARWSRNFCCEVTTLNALNHGFNDFRRVRELSAIGDGGLIDEHGLDWWEIMSILLHGELETLITLQRFARTVAPSDEIYVSRPCFQGRLLQCLLGPQLRMFPFSRKGKGRGLGHFVRVSNKLSASQMIDVFWDKYDAGYQFRGRLTRRRTRSTRPMVLLPTAYVNVSRTGIAYAKTFPEENFLLVSTRRSGWVQYPPQNVAAVWLSSYASVRNRSDENAEIESRWRLLRKELEAVAEFEVLKRLGCLDSFPQRFRHGFEVRDAWRNVLDTEPIQGVICADDSNPYTRIPLLLARARALPNVACHHGALDGRYLFKRSYGHIIWAKGKMEEDYLVRRCEVPKERVEIAAPAMPTNWNRLDSASETSRTNILFISEAFDVTGGRPQEFYGDVLPPLADLALRTGRKLIVKLHPAESERERSEILSRVLSATQKSATHVVSGPLTEDLLARAWFGITIFSTVAVECAVRGIPCFLCKWLEFWPAGYADQFIRFGVGIGLNHPNEIERIPEYLQQHRVGTAVAENCWHAADAGRLRELLTAAHQACATATH